jgi:hypothetical protein
MGKLRGRIGTLLGLSLGAAAWVNVERGSIAPLLVDGAPNGKLDIIRMSDPGCRLNQIALHLDTFGQSHCFGELGTWTGADLMLMAEGGILVLAGVARMPRNPKHAQRVRRAMFLAGAMLFSLAVLDRLALLPGTASSDGLVELVPFIRQGWFFQLVIAFIGMMLMRGPKYRESEFTEVQQGRRAKVNEHRQAFMSTHRSKTASSQPRLARGPTRPMRTRSSPLVRATCPYCKGSGCDRCDALGTL